MICPFPPPAPVQCVVDDVGDSGDDGLANHVDVIARNFSDDEIARRQRFPAETPYVYRLHAEADETYRWDAAAWASIKDYNLLDLSI